MPRVLFPKFVEQSLLDNYPGLSLDDLGVRIVNRQHQYARWEDLPQPNLLTNQSQVVVHGKSDDGHQ